jgi:hypothetical protein
MGLGLAAEVAVELSQDSVANGDSLQFSASLNGWITTNVTDGGNF